MQIHQQQHSEAVVAEIEEAAGRDVRELDDAFWHALAPEMLVHRPMELTVPFMPPSKSWIKIAKDHEHVSAAVSVALTESESRVNYELNQAGVHSNPQHLQHLMDKNGRRPCMSQTPHPLASLIPQKKPN